jgi:hypothetical protein
MHFEIKKLIEKEKLLDRFENGEFALIEKVQITQEMLNDGISEGLFEAIVATNLNRLLFMREHNYEEEPPSGGLMLIRKHRWELMKSRKDLMISLMQDQGLFSREKRDEV